MSEDQFQFLQSIIACPSPSGFEQPIAKLFREYVGPFSHQVTTDVMGNVTAIINPDAPVRFMYAGHMDEIGFIVHYIDENGFLFFNSIGGTDVATEIGQRVWVHGRERVVGVVGRKAIQPSLFPTAKRRRASRTFGSTLARPHGKKRRRW